MNFALTQACVLYLINATRTATTNGQIIEPSGYSMLCFALDITAASGTGGLQLTWQWQDVAPIPAWHNVETPPTAINAAGTFHFLLGRSGAPTPSFRQYVNASPFRRMRCVVTHVDASNYTYAAYLMYGQNS